MALAILGWGWIVSANEIPHYILPGPGRVFDTLVEDWPMLYGSLLVTLKITFLALLTAAHGRERALAPTLVVAELRDGEPAGAALVLAGPPAIGRGLLLLALLGGTAARTAAASAAVVGIGRRTAAAGGGRSIATAETRRPGTRPA